MLHAAQSRAVCEQRGRIPNVALWQDRNVDGTVPFWRPTAQTHPDPSAGPQKHRLCGCQAFLEVRHRLLLCFALEGLLLLPGRILRLLTHHVAAPLAHRLRLVGVKLLARGDKCRERLAVLVGDGSKCDRRGRLLMHELAQPALAFDDGERHLHLAAERGQPGDELDWVDVVRNDDERRLLLLDERRDVVDPIAERDRALRRGSLVGGGLARRCSLDLLLPLRLRVRRVL
mmetsp:Transcript_1122/g.3575  ORF Transcript_1122/g.3575 Transcript_1122/m.3575 type:complete len:230 (+) Transcript_1122:2885-3574(+)